MGLHLYFHSIKTNKEVSVCFLAFLWCFCLSSGACFGSNSNIVLLHMMLESTFGFLSIVIAVLICLLPLAISILSIRFKRSILIYILASMRGFSIGYLLSVFLSLFRSAGWLICCLCFVSCSVYDVILFQVWISYFSDPNGKLKIGAFHLACLFVITLIDQLFIAPFLSKLITYF